MRYLGAVRKLEVGLFKFYVINAYQTNRRDRIVEFFEKMTPEIQNQAEFKDWFGMCRIFICLRIGQRLYSDKVCNLPPLK